LHNQINKIMSKELAITVVEADKIRQYLDAMNLTTNLTKSQVQQFIEISQAFGLNPFKREIYASKYGDNFSIIVGYETYIKRAERSGRLAGWQVTTMGTLAENNLKAVITIHRKDWEYPFTHEVYYSEYVQKTKDGYPTKFWKDKPFTMLKKVAISQGFRLCFSDELGGMPYTSEEMGQETLDTNPVSVETIKPNVQASFEKQPEAKKAGRPKKEVNVVEELIVNRDLVFTRIYLASTIDELNNIYRAHPSLKEDKEFINHLTTRKHQITEQGEYQNPENPLHQSDNSYEAKMSEEGKI